MTNIKLEYLKSLYPNHAIGVDVSRYQGDIDWEIMASRGVLFAAIRATIGDYYQDPMRKAYHDGARANGIYTTDYHVVRADVSAIKQMDYYYFSRPYGPHFKMGLDVEVGGKKIKIQINKKKYEWQYKKFKSSEITDRTLECAEIVKSRDGEFPFFYSYPYFIRDNMEWDDSLTNMELWLASYGVDAPLTNVIDDKWNGWTIWQCLADGDDQGEYFGSGAHGLDVNFYNGTEDEFITKYIRPGENTQAEKHFIRSSRIPRRFPQPR